MNIFLWQFVGCIFVELPVGLWHHHHLVLILVVVAPASAAVLEFFLKNIFIHILWQLLVSVFFTWLFISIPPSSVSSSTRYKSG